jgi:hypothetical protein
MPALPELRMDDNLGFIPCDLHVIGLNVNLLLTLVNLHVTVIQVNWVL